ncbi:hypothetical protein E3E26_01275 [Thermococcus sp. LS1]|uniref:hypothetical protein n=1 Tax=Thermococcus sp. LS1 TaxID=1638259 RepID=UPI0014392E18|nr:hypothetical protein [Thermococcus sp. LS1]NJD98432.1 hypothetical protein [Thermococcus sp. LS1]
MEKVLYVVPNVSYKKGFMSSAAVNLVITNERVIVAHITKETIAKGKEKASGIPGYLAGVTSGYSGRYYEMEPSEILEESGENFVVLMADIKEVKLKTGDYDSGKMDELEIKGRKSLKFKAGPGSMNMKKIKEAFKVAGVKVKGVGFFSI